MRIEISEDFVVVQLAPWQKVLGLMRDIRVARAAIGDVRVVADPIDEVMRKGLKIGLRLPWLYYVARSIRLDETWIVRRAVPALSFSVADGGALRRVLLSTPQAPELARRLGGSSQARDRA